MGYKALFEDWEIKQMDAVTILPYFTVEEEYMCGSQLAASKIQQKTRCASKLKRSTISSKPHKYGSIRLTKYL
jgi:hypothetical protein